ncbi:MAG: hypothetical protein ACTIJ6_03050 [Leucobacter sp.]
MTKPTSRNAANRALSLVLGAGIVAWLLFVLAILSDIIIDTGHTWGELSGPDAVVTVRPSTYLFFAAIAVFTLGGLLGRRQASRLQASARPTRLARAVLLLASTVLIIGMVLAAIGAITVFMSNFFEGTGNDGVFDRILNSYLPIVLYTALVVTVILTGFVFTRSHEGSEDDADSMQEERETAATSTPGEATGQRATALAYTLPIVAVAVALIFGLIVYDVTQTALEAWIWVIVQSLIAVGIIAGTVFAARALAAHTRSGSRPAAASVGAKNMNFVLSIIFVVAVTSMSLGYGASALEYLRVQSSLSISAYVDSEPSTDTEVDPEDVTLSINGYDLERGSDAVISLEPNGEVLMTAQVDRSGSLWRDVTLPTDIAAGDHDATVQAVRTDGRELSISLPMTTSDEGTVRFTAEPYASVDDEDSSLAPPTVSWFLSDLAPAAILLLLAVTTLYLTVNRRNRGK